MEFKNISFCLALFFLLPVLSFGYPIQENPETVDTSAINGLIKRIAPAYFSEFVIEPIPGDEQTEMFEIESQGGKIILRGNSTLAITRAFNWYLNNYCLTSVSWYKAEPIDIPAVLPSVPEKVEHSCRFEKRFFLKHGFTRTQKIIIACQRPV